MCGSRCLVPRSRVLLLLCCVSVAPRGLHAPALIINKETKVISHFCDLLLVHFHRLLPPLQQAAVLHDCEASHGSPHGPLVENLRPAAIDALLRQALWEVSTAEVADIGTGKKWLRVLCDYKVMIDDDGDRGPSNFIPTDSKNR